jgi:hypothetical protein
MLDSDLKINVLSMNWANTPEMQEQVILAISSIPELVPTRWGDDPPKKPFETDSIKDIIKLLKADYVDLVFKRTKDPKWEAIYIHLEGRFQQFSVRLTAPSKRLYQTIFTWADSISEVLRPEFGVVDVITLMDGRETSDGTSAFLKPIEYMRHGPGALCARSYLGAKLIGQIGQDLLLKSKLEIHEREWGVIADLVPSPWEADPAEFGRKQIEAMQVLEQSGMFCHYDTGLFTNGAKWTPRA